MQDPNENTAKISPPASSSSDVWGDAPPAIVHVLQLRTECTRLGTGGRAHTVEVAPAAAQSLADQLDALGFVPAARELAEAKLIGRIADWLCVEGYPWTAKDLREGKWKR